MPTIRRQASEDDVVVGIAGSSKGGLGRIHPQLIYWMRVTHTKTFDEYWSDPKFTLKKPFIAGPNIRKVGDNTYRHENNDPSWKFEESMHFLTGAKQLNGGHVTRDTSVDRVLVAEEFTYWGGSGPKIPDRLMPIFPKTRNYKINHDDTLLEEFHQFIDTGTPLGLVGDPADWANSKYFQ